MTSYVDFKPDKPIQRLDIWELIKFVERTGFFPLNIHYCRPDNEWYILWNDADEPADEIYTDEEMDELYNESFESGAAGDVRRTLRAHALHSDEQTNLPRFETEGAAVTALAQLLDKLDYSGELIGYT